MAKQKDFFAKLIQKLKRDAGMTWTRNYIDDALTLAYEMEPEQGEPDLVGYDFFASLQQEACVRNFDEMTRRKTGKRMEDPFIYPGLMAAWEKAPVTVDFDRASIVDYILEYVDEESAKEREDGQDPASGADEVDAACEPESDFSHEGEPDANAEDGVAASHSNHYAADENPLLESVSAADVRSVFPSCMVFDIRDFKMRLYGTKVDALAVYPSYDADRDYGVLLGLGLNLQKGLGDVFESKLVLQGDSLIQMINASIDERERLRGRCLAGLDTGMHDDIFTPYDDEQKIMMLIGSLLGLLLWDGTCVQLSERRGIPHLHVKMTEEGEDTGVDLSFVGMSVTQGRAESAERAHALALEAMRLHEEAQEAEEAEAKAKAEARAKAEERARVRAEARAAKEAEKKAAAQARAQAEAEAKARAEERARARAEAEAQAQALEEVARAEAQALAEAEAEARAKENAEAQAEAVSGSGAVSHAKAPEDPPAAEANPDTADNPPAADKPHVREPEAADGILAPDRKPPAAAEHELTHEEALFELELLREQMADQKSKMATLEYHLKQARASVDEARKAAAGASARVAVLESLDIPETPIEALELAARAFPDKLLFLPEARKSAIEFRKGSASEVWAVLRSMATALHPLVFGRGGGSMTHAFESATGFELTLREMKLIKKSSSYARFRTVNYKGEEHDASAHVKGKGFKKGETLRVHFFADYDDNRIVVTHCGEHLPTFDTSSL